MTEIRCVLDTTALVAYMQGTTSVVGRRIAAANDREEIVLIPATCLTQAYAEADSVTSHMLDLISDLPNVKIAPMDHTHCPILGGWSRKLGSMDLAHALVEAAAYPTVPIITSRADLAWLILPKEWPIITP